MNRLYQYSFPGPYFKPVNHDSRYCILLVTFRHKRCRVLVIVSALSFKGSLNKSNNPENLKSSLKGLKVHIRDANLKPTIIKPSAVDFKLKDGRTLKQLKCLFSLLALHCQRPRFILSNEINIFIKNKLLV